MAFVRKTYSEITDSILSQITRGVVIEKFEYVAGKTAYALEQPGAESIVKAEGTVNGSRFLFGKTDVMLHGNTIEWLSGTKPDNHTPFFVSYTIDVPTGITDVNPGSVTRTLVESIALEMDYLYAQLNQVYNSAYIDTASGKALDLVVALLGVSRKPAGYAIGEATFGRNNEPGVAESPKEAFVLNGQGSRYELKNGAVKTIKNVEGESNGSKVKFAEGTDFKLAGDAIVWLPSGKRPNPGSVFYVDYTVYEKIVIPKDTVVSTYSRNPANTKTFRTTRDASLIKTPEGRWEVDVPVAATVPGKEGNVFLGSINVMPKPVPRIEYVINKRDILSGTEVESDAELRERAKRALEKAGKATLRSLRSAVQGVDGVTGDVVVIDRPDGVPGIIQIIASGGDPAEIGKVIEDTRSAGILVEFKRPAIVPLDIKIVVAVVQGIDAGDVKARVDIAIRNYLGTLNIGDDVIVSRIIESALSVTGIKDAREITINDKKENVRIKEDEKGEYRTLEIFLEA